MKEWVTLPSLSASTVEGRLSAFLLGAKVFSLDKRGRHCEGLLLIRSSQSGGHSQLGQVSWIHSPPLTARWDATVVLGFGGWEAQVCSAAPVEVQQQQHHD